MSFNQSRFSITCCKDCKPPERYPGCGDHCQKYKEEKARIEELKKEYRKQTGPVLTQFDYNINNQRDTRARHKKIYRH